MNKKQKIKFISYGNDKFKISRQRIKEEAESLNFFTDVEVYTEETISKLNIFKNAIKNNNFKNVFEQERGGGYWIWKPIIIYEALRRSRENDIVFYADSGCTIEKTEKTINMLKKCKDIVENHESGTLICDQNFCEKDWTKGDIFKHFQCLQDENISHTRQISASAIVFRKCSLSNQIFTLFYKTAVEYPDLFSDKESLTPNFPGFKENRHDQSVLSVIAKMFNFSKEINYCQHPIKVTRRRQ